MRSLWDAEAPSAADPLALRAYSSRLLGRDRSLVLHGGGNTSVKLSERDFFGDEIEVLRVKASGFDLATMGPEGFTALRLSVVRRLGEMDALSDPDMVRELLIARLAPDAASPSVEAILHGLIKHQFVDHTHADAVLTVSNTPNGTERLRDIYGDDTLIMSYVKPGFDLALQIREQIRAGMLKRFRILVLEHHGVFTWSDDARDSYEAMIAAVGRAEAYLARHTTPPALSDRRTSPLAVAKARQAASTVAGRALLSVPGPAVTAEAAATLARLTRHGTVTPEHVIHNKPFPAVLELDDPATGINTFAADYQAYFERDGTPGLVVLSRHPNWALFQDGTTRAFGPNVKRAGISADVVGVTIQAVLRADQLGGWQGLDEAELRALEYWELEQIKLTRQPADPPLAGKIAVVCGAATGIGRATAELLHRRGAAVIGLDNNPAVRSALSAPGLEGRVVDLCDESATASMLGEIVQEFGGLDILVLNAGIFRAGKRIEELDDGDWDASLALNLSAHRTALKHAIPFLRHGVDPAVVFVGSRNATAPGAGAAAYSVSKAGLTQLMRVAALELAADGIRVNAVHPDAVFDTPLWTPDALATSAARYGLTVEQYKSRNLLKTEIRSGDVAAAIVTLADATLSCTTGAQLPVDGGNDRVI